MDHHILLTGSVAGEIKVPCLCDPPYYTGALGSFITYPRGKKKPWLVADEGGIPLIHKIGHYELQHHPSMSEMQAFYQEWLFFGFVKETLGEYFNASAFVSEEAHGNFITTRDLRFLLEQALPLRLRDPEPGQAIFDHLSSCAQDLAHVVKTMQAKLDRQTRSNENVNNLPPAIDWRVVV